MFDVKRSAFVLVFIVLLPSIGCEKKYPPAPVVSTELPMDLIKAQAQYELRNMGITPIDPDTEADPSKKLETEIEESLKTAAEITDTEKRDAAHVDIAKKLIFLQEYEKASDVVRLIKNSREKDTLLEDLVRVHLSDAARLYSPESRLFSNYPSLKTVQKSDSPKSNPPVELALGNAREIADPVKRFRAFEDIALHQLGLRDAEGEHKTILECAETYDNIPNDNPGKAMRLCQLVRSLLRIGEKNRAKKLCDEGAPLVDKIVDAKIKIATQLDLVGLSLLLIGVDDSDPEKYLKQLKNRVLKTAAGISPTAVSGGFAEYQDDASLSSPLNRNYSWRDLRKKKNETLQKIARQQVWQGSLEDVWETAEEIDEPSIRDNVLAEAIDMMIAIKSWEDAAGWSEEIADPLLKKEVRRKIVQKKKAAEEAVFE